MPYLTLDEIPEGRLCRPLFIPDDPLWLALFGGALTELAAAYNYVQFGTLTPQEMADACAAVIAQWYDEICASCELPDNEPILSVDENFQLRELIDGSWQEPTGDYYIPPPAARTEPTSFERRCLAAANAEQALHDTYEAITDAFGEGLAVLEALTDVGIFIAARVFSAAGLVFTALGRIALAAFRIGFEAVEFVTADFWDAAFSDNLRCSLFNHATDAGGVVTFDFDAINQDLINQIEWLDPTLGSFAIAGQVRWMLYQLTPEALDLMGALEDVETADCDDCTAWCNLWEPANFSDWAAQNFAGFTNQPSGILDGSGWHSRDISVSPGGSGACHYDVVALRLTMPVTTRVTNVDCLFDLVLGSSNGSCQGGQPIASITLFNGATQVGTATGSGYTTGLDRLASWAGSVSANIIEVRINASFWRPSLGGSAGSALISQIKIAGELTDPYEYDNCD